MAIHKLIKFSAATPHNAAHLILIAAKSGEPIAQAKLGQILLDGYGITQDAKLAFKWFYISAQHDCLEAMNMLGRCYENGWGCEIDYSKAAHYYQLAAEKAFDWGQYNLANLLIKGLGVKKDLQKAFDLYYQAAQKGHAKSMNLVGRFYEEGWLFETDLEKAVSWYRRSASVGDFRGQCSYASVLTAQGRVDEAVMWLRQSMQTATHGFLQKMARVLCESPHNPLQMLAIEMFERCAMEGDDEDKKVYQKVIRQTIGRENVITNS